MNNRIVLGLTGPTGCGKTQASLFLQSCGFVVVNADEIVKDLYLNCYDLIKQIGFRFEGVVENNNINKKKLAKIVFSSSNDLKTLEDMVWPFVLEQINLQIKKNSFFDLVLDVPMLFESGVFRFCDCSLALLAEKSTCIDRIVNRDGLTLEEALNRINSQKSDGFYINNADCLIFNDGSKNSLFRSLLMFLNKLKVY